VTDWAAFVGVTGAVLAVVLVLARLSQAYVPESDGASGDRAGTGTGDPLPAYPERDPPDRVPLGGRPPEDDPLAAPHEHHPRAGDGGHGAVGPRSPPRERAGDRPELSTGALLANVAVSQGLFGAVLVGAAVYAAVPASALGLAGTTPAVLAAGALLGVALYAANEVGAAVADRVGIGHDESLRAALAPDSAAGWVLLLGVVLPVIAGFEELLFRAALVGAVPAGYGVSPWLMVGLSSVAFGAGHGAQGRAGVAVTTALGGVLGAAYVLTGSLLAVVVAHYLVNALEFVVHEGLGVEWVPSAGAGG
jgi:membrane protease YdiL (CAAX protease family)